MIKSKISDEDIRSLIHEATDRIGKEQITEIRDGLEQLLAIELLERHDKNWLQDTKTVSEMRHRLLVRLLMKAEGVLDSLGDS